MQEGGGRRRDKGSQPAPTFVTGQTGRAKDGAAFLRVCATPPRICASRPLLALTLRPGQQRRGPPMQVEPHTDPHWPAQRTYARKQTGEEGRPLRQVDAALEQRADTTLETTASSSPSHLFESSPVRAKGAGMGADRSCDTTVSSDDDGAEEDVMPRKHDARRSELLLSDDDDDDDGGGVKDTESDAAFLARFRRARAGAKGLPGGHSASTLASSDLSDPPSLTDSSLPHPSRSTAIPDSSALDNSDVQSEPASAQSSPSPHKSCAGLLPDSLQSSNSPTPSPYITEAQKQQAERTRKESRETKVKALAKRARQRSAKEASGGAQGEDEDDGVDEVVESTSDIEDVADEDDLPNAIKAAQTASLARRQAEERSRAEKEAKKASRGKGKQAASSVLQMRAEDEESDSDLEHSVQQTDKARVSGWLTRAPLTTPAHLPPSAPEQEGGRADAQDPGAGREGAQG